MGRCNDELNGNALDGDPERTVRASLDERDDGRRALEEIEGCRLARHERELVDDVAPAADLAGDLRSELARDRLGERAGAIDQQAAAPARTLAGEAGEDLALRLRADPLRLAQPSG